MTNPFWWPLDLSKEQEVRVRIFHSKLNECPPTIDGALLSRSADLLANLMSSHIGRILDRDGLPHICHVVNGWGNSVYQGRLMADRMTSFVQRGVDGKPFFLQRDPEGEFHPWQSFAYALMAGIDPNTPLAPGSPSLRDLAKTSRRLNTTDGHELGHLLFALAHLDPNLEGGPFYLRDNVLSGEDIIVMAIHAHHFGSFEVCRKFHLTEGIAAMAALSPGMTGHRETAQGFLDGQLDILFVLGAMLEEVKIGCQSNRIPHSDSLLVSFRNSLIVGDFFENHAYYAGHLIELAGFAAIQGYRVKSAHRAAIAFVANEINATLPHIAALLSFPDCFLHFGHYRRAITLCAELESVNWRATAIGPLELRRYAVDFDSPPAATEIHTGFGDPMSRVLELGLYQLEQPTCSPRPRFLEVIACYEQIARDDLKARGGFDHFRRIGPARWPRAFHYELLDYGDCVGVEVHLESDAVLPLGSIIRNLASTVSKDLYPFVVEWDQSWCKSRGRLRALYPDDVGPEEIASALAKLINSTFTAFDLVATELAVPALRGANATANASGSLLPG